MGGRWSKPSVPVLCEVPECSEDWVSRCWGAEHRLSQSTSHDAVPSGATRSGAERERGLGSPRHTIEAGD